ncbi:MAG: alpha-1,4-glucan--maltose-1-phosphate maltosyltransferase [Candidatus Acidiferrales bacterium]
MHSSRIATEVSLPSLRRVVIENVEPEVDGGRFAIKRVVGESVSVEADINADGHQVLDAVLCFRAAGERGWSETPMRAIGNDRWQGRFQVPEFKPYAYTVQAWLDPYKTWIRDLAKKAEAGQDVSLDFLAGAELAAAAATRAQTPDAQRLLELSSKLKTMARTDRQSALGVANSDKFTELMTRYPDRSRATTYEKELQVWVDRPKARFSSWYELFPRSCTTDAQKPGTFRDCMRHLPYVAEMGFDVLYFPPIHPIGRKGRKGKNNSLEVAPGDPGSPWAIGSVEGGHKAIHPALGTLEDFKQLRQQAEAMGIEMALDIAFQCAPDHPYVKEHEDWFAHRPDGSIQYAENPPKKYEDIYPLDFESADAVELCEELKSVVLYWIDQGIRIFRVDNPHTKPFGFWEWLIAEIHGTYPDVIFLAEAFTRPKVMYRLAKLGFTQSYTYFTWKNTKTEITELFEELTQTPVREFFRMNLWPNTPDILHAYLQNGGRPAFIARLILAATLGANYGIYGPAFELFENRPLAPDSEEYLESEKYQIRVWDIDRPDSLKQLIALVNKIRHENPALQSDWSLRFHPVDNDQLIAYSKTSSDGSNIILVVVNLDPRNTRSGSIYAPLDYFGIGPQQPFEVHDLLADARYTWQGSRNYIELNPAKIPAHIFKVR